MRSRYDYFDESVSCDEDGICWPDPLTIDYNKGDLAEMPAAYVITAADLSKFWLFMFKKYGTVDLDDILLEENNVSYLMNLKPGDTIYCPINEDLLNFISTSMLAEIS